MKAIYKIDYLDLLKSIPDESIDLVVTDPPYESLEAFRAVGTTTRLTESWFGTIPNAALPQLLAEMYRVLKPDSHAYLFCDERTAHAVRSLEFTGEKARYGAPVMKSGFTYWKELIWVKTSNKNPNKPDGGMGYHYRGANERILFLEKGKRQLVNKSTCDVLLFPRRRNAKNPTAKPPELIRVLIEQSCPEAGVVLDPFAGTGSAAVAALSCGRDFIVGDMTLDALDDGLAQYIQGPTDFL